MSAVESDQSFVLDVPTILSIVFALSLGPIAQIIAWKFLPSNVSRGTYYLFLWHCYDALTHFLIEGSYLFHSFFSYIDLPIPVGSSDHPHPASISSETVAYFLGDKFRRYGPVHGYGPTARLWQEYAKADRRWGESDVTVISIELLTVGLAGPFAAYICYLIYQLAKVPSTGSKNKATKTYVATLTARLHILAAILATGELYGGFMTFAPEWLSGSTALDTSNPMFLWLYLFFFNILWVIIPIFILIWVWGEVGRIYGGATDGVVTGMGAKGKKE